MNKKAENSPFVEKNKLSPKIKTVTKDELTITEARKLLPESLRHLNLNPREYKFVAVYCSNNFNAIDAVEKAGYVERTKAKYRAIAYSLLQRKEIVEAVKLYIDIVIQPYRDRLELELLNTYYRRATYDISTFYNENGLPKSLSDIDLEWRCCIDDINYIVMNKGTFTINAYKLPNRDTALQTLYRFVTGQDVTSSNTLPEDAKKKIANIYQTVIKANKVTVKPKNIKQITPLKNEE